MTIAIHQPNFLPWLGFFDKIQKSDHFVFLDDVEFVKGHICNRQKIKDNKGQAKWLTIPVNHNKGLSVNFNELEIDYNQNWESKVLNQIRGNYSAASYFEPIFTELSSILKARKFSSLADLNITLIKYCCEKLKISTSFSRSSQINSNVGIKSDRNLNICLHYNADTYLSGQGAKKYNDTVSFKNAGVKLIYQEFEHPEYEQINGDFLPNLTIIDLLLNCGPKSGKILKSNTY